MPDVLDRDYVGNIEAGMQSMITFNHLFTQSASLGMPS